MVLNSYLFSYVGNMVIVLQTPSCGYTVQAHVLRSIRGKCPALLVSWGRCADNRFSFPFQALGRSAMTYSFSTMFLKRLHTCSRPPVMVLNSYPDTACAVFRRSFTGSSEGLSRKAWEEATLKLFSPPIEVAVNTDNIMRKIEVISRQ